MTNTSQDQVDQNIAVQLVEKWSVLTADQKEERSRIPLRVLFGEAVDLAEVVEKYFDDEVAGGKVRLGLNSVVGKGSLTEKTAQEMVELQIAAAKTHSRYLTLVEQASQAPVERADEILDELRLALTFLLEDSDNPRGEEQLNRLRDEYGDVTSHDGMAMALEGYSELGVEYIEDLKELGGFDESLVDQAVQVARALRQRSADKLTGAIPQEQRDTMRLRNRLIGALLERMRAGKKSIRYVFRDYPEIASKAGSDYLRSKQRARRKSASDAPSSGITGTEPTVQMPAVPGGVNKG